MAVGRTDGVTALPVFFIRKCIGLLPGQNKVALKRGSQWSLTVRRKTAKNSTVRRKKLLKFNR